MADDFPKVSKIAQVACSESIVQIVRTIHNIDITIYQWNNMLEKAQPLMPGRLIFRFMERNSWLINGESQKEKKPYPGKMIKLISGGWRFVLLDRDDHYKNLSDLRVGKNMPSDALVKKLIDGIEELLKERDFLENHLRQTRMLVTTRCRSINTKADKMFAQDGRLRARIKLDWKDHADESLEAVKKANHERYEARKLRRAQSAG